VAGVRAAGVLAAGVFAAGVLAAGCATPVVDAVEERLDHDTGTTVMRLASPVELLATAPRGRNLDPFVYIAPFETNRVGERQLYLWVATGGDSTAVPSVHCGDGALTAPPTTPPTAPLEAPPGAPLAGGMPPVGMGIARLPYRAPASWSAVHVIPIDAAWLDCLGSGTRLEVEVGEERFAGDGSRGRDLAEFAERVRE